MSRDENDGDLAPARYKQYVTLLDAIGNPTLRSSGGETKFMYAGSGIGREWQKGIWFTSDCGGYVVVSAHGMAPRDTSYCRNIDASWNVLYEQFD